MITIKQVEVHSGGERIATITDELEGWGAVLESNFLSGDDLREIAKAKDIIDSLCDIDPNIDLSTLERKVDILSEEDYDMISRAVKNENNKQ